jgi:hypothetical protein
MLLGIGIITALGALYFHFHLSVTPDSHSRCPGSANKINARPDAKVSGATRKERAKLEARRGLFNSDLGFLDNAGDLNFTSDFISVFHSRKEEATTISPGHWSLLPVPPSHYAASVHRNRRMR